MKLARILVLAACTAFGAIVGALGPAQAAPTAGLALAAPTVRSLEQSAVESFPVEKTYYYYRRHYYHPYYHRWNRRHYYRHYYHPYYHRWHRYHYYRPYHYRRWHPFYW